MAFLQRHPSFSDRHAYCIELWPSTSPLVDQLFYSKASGSWLHGVAPGLARGTLRCPLRPADPSTRPVPQPSSGYFALVSSVVDAFPLISFASKLLLGHPSISGFSRPFIFRPPA